MLNDVARLKRLVEGLRIGADDRRRQLLEPLQLGPVRDPACLSRSVGRHERREEARGRRRATRRGSGAPCWRSHPDRRGTSQAETQPRSRASVVEIGPSRADRLRKGITGLQHRRWLTPTLEWHSYRLGVTPCGSQQSAGRLGATDLARPVLGTP